jgi:hypothetical protein
VLGDGLRSTGSRTAQDERVSIAALNQGTDMVERILRPVAAR